MSWRDTIKGPEESKPIGKSWRDTITQAEPTQPEPNGRKDILDKLAAMPESIGNAFESATDYLGRSVRGEIPVSEQIERLGTVARGAGDVVQRIGDLPSKAISSVLPGMNYQGPGDKPTARALSDSGLGDFESMEAKDAKYPGARGLGQSLPAFALPGATAPQVAASSALTSYGAQGEDANFADVADDTLLGLGAFRGMQGVQRAAPYAGQAAKGTAKRSLGMAADLNPESIDYYLQNSAKVKAARPLDYLAGEVQQGINQAAKDVSRLSGESYNILERAGTGIDKQSIADAFAQRAKKIEESGIFTPGAQKDFEQLMKLSDQIKAYPGEIAGAKLKGLLRQLDDMVDYENVKSGAITPSLDREIKGVRSEVDQGAKFLNDAYREKMAETARTAQILEDIKPRFDTDEKAFNSLKGIARDRSPFQKKDLQALDQYLGKDLAGEARAAGIKAAFENQTTNGSRNVNLGGRVGEAAGGLGNAIGAAVGYAKDTLARPTAKGVLDLSIAIEPYAQRLGKYAKPLLNAAKKGPQAFLLTHQILSRDPEYQALTQGTQE